MANCPKCEHHLRLLDWKQKCPYCGANIVMYNLQERLMQDADKAEVEYYYNQKKMDRVKASFIGSPLAVVRIFTSLLPIGALFLPLLTAVSVPAYPDVPSKMTVIQIYNLIDQGSGVTLLRDAAVVGAGGRLFFAGVVCLLLSIVLWLLHFIFLILACSPHGKARNYTVSILHLVCAVAFPVLITVMPHNAFASASLGIGAYLYVALSVINLVVEILVFRKGIEVKHAQCYVGGIPIEEYFEMQKNGVPQEELRAEMYRRLKALQQEKEQALAEKVEKNETDKKEAATHE